MRERERHGVVEFMSSDVSSVCRPSAAGDFGAANYCTRTNDCRAPRAGSRMRSEYGSTGARTRRLRTLSLGPQSQYNSAPAIRASNDTCSKKGLCDEE